jgi:hypothetical protein
VIDDMLPIGAGRWQVDGVKLHDHLRQQNLEFIAADAELHVADGGAEMIYTARLDEVPDALVEVDMGALPGWLHRT